MRNQMLSLCIDGLAFQTFRVPKIYEVDGKPPKIVENPFLKQWMYDIVLYWSIDIYTIYNQ